MAFVKTMMSVLGYLRFIPSSKFYAIEVERNVDLSSASVMGRQVVEDVISFLYLSQPSLTNDQKRFRELVWKYCGVVEAVKSASFAGVTSTVLEMQGTIRDKMRAQLEQEPNASLLRAIEKNQRGRIKIGQNSQVLHVRDILGVRGIRHEAYDLPHKVLSNFAHFSDLSRMMIMETNAEWQKSWRPFLYSATAVSSFAAEAIEAFLETFPSARPVVTETENTLIQNRRLELRQIQTF